MKKNVTMTQIKKFIRTLCLTIGLCLAFAYFSATQKQSDDIEKIWLAMVLFTTVIILYDIYREKFSSLPKTIALWGSLFFGGFSCGFWKMVNTYEVFAPHIKMYAWLSSVMCIASLLVFNLGLPKNIRSRII